MIYSKKIEKEVTWKVDRFMIQYLGTEFCNRYCTLFSFARVVKAVIPRPSHTEYK